METEILKVWEKQKDKYKKLLREMLLQRGDLIRYTDLIDLLIKSVFSQLETRGYGEDEEYTVIDNGDYQGTLVFMIPENGYQPDNYIITKVNYGSCSVCDTLESITTTYVIDKNLYVDDNEILDTSNKEYKEIEDTAVSDLFTLGLHLIQRAKFV